MEGDFSNYAFQLECTIFQSTPSAWRETDSLLYENTDSYSFQSTPSAWRETTYHIYHIITYTISIHSLRMEGDPQFDVIFDIQFVFQSTPSAWRETGYLESAQLHLYISIHSLRMEGDDAREIYIDTPKDISIHSLRMEGDTVDFAFLKASQSFQSTPSAWRETTLISRQSRFAQYFNPLPPHGGRLWDWISA